MTAPVHMSGPQCPACKLPLVPIEAMPRPEAYWSGERVGCPCCGKGYVVGDAIVIAATRAQRAWDRSRKARETVAAKKRAGWTPRPPTKRAQQMGLSLPAPDDDTTKTKEDR